MAFFIPNIANHMIPRVLFRPIPHMPNSGMNCGNIWCGNSNYSLEISVPPSDMSGFCKMLMDKVVTPSVAMAKDSQKQNGSGSKHVTSNKKEKLKDNPAEAFKDATYEQIKEMKEIEKQIKDLKTQISKEKDADKKATLNNKLQDLINQYTDKEIDLFNGNNISAIYGRGDKYDFYSNLSETEFNSLTKQNARILSNQEKMKTSDDEIAKKKDEWSEAARALDNCKKMLNSGQPGLNIGDRKADIRKLEAKMQSLDKEIRKLELRNNNSIKSLNTEIDRLDNFIKKAVSSLENANYVDVVQQEENVNQRNEDKKALDGALFDANGKLKTSIKESDIPDIKVDGNTIDKKELMPILDKLVKLLKEKGADKNNIKDKITELMKAWPDFRGLFLKNDNPDKDMAKIVNEIVLMYTGKKVADNVEVPVTDKKLFS